MNTKKEIKESYLSIRIPSNTKKAFQRVAQKRDTKVSKMLLEFIDEQIKIEDLSKIEVDKNQMQIPM